MTWREVVMAIWDNATASANCPTCGDSLRYDTSIKRSVCRSCGNVYEPGTLNFTGKFKFADTAPASEAEENKKEYVCGSCGAVVVTNENTSATFCAFCGSPSLVIRRLTREFRPDYVIPFKIDEKQAEEKVKTWLKENKKIKSVFRRKASTGKLTGIYIPFWLLNAECHANVSGLGFLTESYTGRAVYSFTREFIFRVKNVPFDGCIGISNFLMNSIEPFEFNELKQYDDGYLPGYFAYRYDRNALQMTDIIDIRLSDYAKQAGEMFVKSKSMESDTKYDDALADASDSYIKDLSQSYALLPVWFMTLKYKGDEYYIAINGQTGKVGGDVPEIKGSGTASYFKNVVLKTAPWVAAMVSIWVLTWYVAQALTPNVFLQREIFVLESVIMSGLVLYIEEKYRRALYSVEYTPGSRVMNKTNVSDYYDYSYSPKMVDKQDKLVGFQVRKLEGRGRDAHYSDWNWIT